MKQYEYKILTIEFDEKENREDKILGALNSQGKNGWLVCSMNADPELKEKTNSVKVLLAREKSKKQKPQLLEDAAGDEDFVDEVIKKIENDPL